LFEYRIFSFFRQSVTLRRIAGWLCTSSLTIYRVLAWALLVTALAGAAFLLGLRYWLLPNADRYRERLALAVSQAANQRITIGSLSGNWDGLRPQLVLEDVTVHDPDGKPVLTLSRIDNVLSWLSVTTLEPRFHSLEIRAPALAVRRDARGAISVAGVEVKEEMGGGGFADWLLRQREVVVRGASVTWLDEMRGAPPLELGNVSLLMHNRGERHRFGLHATPPAHLSGALDIRGEFRGRTLAALAEWNGRLFVQLDYVDLAGWKAWVDYPVEVGRGEGALRTWLTFSRNALTELIADVQLAGVKSRLAADLPELDLVTLAGRVSWKASAAGHEFAASKLGLTAQQGLTLQPADFLLRLEKEKGRIAARGELRANALDLEPLAVLADRLPLDAALRRRLVELSPKGSLFDVVARWSGDWSAPHQYTVRGRFHDLALNRSAGLPGFAGVTGSIDGNEKSGTLHLTSSGATLDMPSVFRDRLGFDSFVAQMTWTRGAADTELRLNNVSFANSHLAGTLFGSYRAVPDKRGVIDITGNLTRADGRHAARYVPLVLDKATRDWLDVAFLAGQSSDVALRLKGDLERFPFPDGKGGVFQVTAKITGGVLDYARGWPRIENISGDLVFRGKRMDIHAKQGTIMGVQLARVHAEIPDLTAEEELLLISGEAEGPTADFLAFIDRSPVIGMIDRFTEGMRAQGNGRLALKLTIPLRALGASKVAGSYQFVNNRIVADPDLPPLEQVSGRLDFTESSVRVPGASVVFLGGPATVSGSTRGDGSVQIDLQGRANIDNVRRSAGNPWWSENLRGSADWRGTLTLRNRLADLEIESNLQGIASNLPAPFLKPAAEAVPLRYTRRFDGQQQDRIAFSYGDVVSAQLVRRIEGGRAAVSRGTIRFGGAAAEPERDGVWVSGTLKTVDLDRWLAFLRGDKGVAPFDLSGFDLKVGELIMLGRPFHEAAVSGAAQQRGLWQVSLAAREFDGTAEWRGQGRGRLTARMKKLTIPASVAAGAAAEKTEPARQDLPALDVVAEQFQFKDKALGRLELLATPEERDWRIEKLRITNPDSTVSADGAVQDMTGKPRTRINFNLDTTDIGRLLTRLGYPEGVRRGTAKLEGSLVWAGAPQDFDYPLLSGNLVLEAAKGQFVKLEPGIGKLLGILNLQALPRRITLDFRDIFSEGFAFDQIVGTVRISQGIATTDSFRISGPSARVAMTGEVDLARETQKLRVRITPSISDGVSIAGALLGGPVAGVAAYLAQKILRDPLDQLVSYEYGVTGTWSEPQVSKIERPSAFQTDGQQP
jgi:uncharacterized protein (TIGR02099 family)